MQHSVNVKDDEFVKKLVDWADIIRKTFYDGGIEEIISTRRLGSHTFVHTLSSRTKQKQSKFV